MRVGATSKSPMPASAGVASAKSGAARTAADTKALMLTVILTIPVGSGLERSPVFSSGMVDFRSTTSGKRAICGACGGSIVDGDVERAGIEAAGRGRTQRDRAAEREDCAFLPAVLERDRSRIIHDQHQSLRGIGLIGQRDV